MRSMRGSLIVLLCLNRQVFEMSRDWWGVWTMEAQSSTPPRGFDVAVKYRDPFYTEGDHYWAYHHHDTNDEVEVSGW